MSHKPIFRSSISDENGDVDVGYLALFWGLIGWSTALAVILIAGGYAVYKHPDKAGDMIQAMGVAVGAVSGGFATMLGAVGLFRIGDKNRPPEVSTTTTHTTKETIVEGPQGTSGEPLQVEVANKDPVPVIETKPKAKGKR